MENTESNHPLELALFGTGRIGTVHFKNMLTNPKGFFKWLIEEDVQRAQQLTISYNLQSQVNAISIKDAENIYKDSSVEAVVICTPHATHEGIIKAALKAGKPVFCEKPLALTVKAVKECYQLAESMKLPLFCGFQRRFDPQLRKLYNHIQAGNIGKVRILRSVSMDPVGMAPKEYLMVSGNIFVDSCVHDIDIICWMAGEIPISVYATGYASAEISKECEWLDTVLVTLNFPSGAIGTIQVCREAQVGGYYQGVEVFGSKGMIQSDNKRETDLVRWSDSGAERDPIHQDFQHRYNDAYRMEMDNFIDIVKGNAILEVTASSTLNTLTIAEACQRSVETGNVVDLKTFTQSFSD